jgi:Rrf2 family iron-sulfur cluster assembly transcriptional regulator
MLTSTSEHALRALVELARLENGEAVLARCLSASAGVPLRYLSKILGTLARAGILQASRGPGGGYRLGRPAREIALIEVVELFEGVRARPDCLFGGGRRCSDEDPCGAHEEWKKVRQSYIEFLESKTIADISGPGPREA